MSFKQLYPYQEKYLEGVPSRYIFSADLGCFAGDTPVATPEGYRRIDAIRKGDLVFSYTDDGKIITAKVDAAQETSNKPKPMIQFIYGNTKTTIRATYDHPFFDGERYYPLYQLIWGSLEASQRLQLELLCKQYGQVIDYTPSWGIKGSDNEAWERPNRTPADSYEWQNYKSPQSSCSNLDTKSKQFTVHQSQRLQPKEQQNREPRMVYTETEQPTRIQKRTTLSVARKSETEQSKIFNHTPRNAAPDMANMGTKSQSKSIHSIIGDISTVQQKRTKKHSTRAIEIQSVEILPTQTYYALSIAGKWHTYIVANLPVHNTGKTPLAIVHYIRKAYPQPLLILAPASKVRAGDWERELAEVFAAHNLALPEYQILSYDKFAYNPSNDAFRAGKRPKWHEFAPDYGGREWAIIADEVQYCKAPSSNRSKALYHVAKNASFFVGLSGTPMPNGWIDFANYSKIFGFTKGITEFKKKYCDIQTYKGFPEIVGYWRIPELEKQWRSIAKPLSREDATELPERTFYNIKLKAPRIYFEYLVDRKNEQGVLLDNPSKLAHALRQSLAKNKIDRLDEILSSTSDNVVVFYNYELELQLIKEMLAKKHKDKMMFEQNGHKHEIPPKETWERVSNSVTLAHYKSGATGVEMQYANITIYYSPTYSYAEYEQSKGRTHRNGQTKKCIYYRFYSVGTIEKNIWECIAQKKDFSESLWIKKTLDNIK